MEGFDIFNEISEIQNYINKSNEKQNKTKQTEKQISRRFIELHYF